MFHSSIRYMSFVLKTGLFVILSQVQCKLLFANLASYFVNNLITNRFVT